MNESTEVPPITPSPLTARHRSIGWWSLAAFAGLGVILEGLLAFKAPALVDAGRETTRSMLRLAHAHGTLLALVNLLFSATCSRPTRLASRALLTSQVLLPGGFLLGAFGARGGDPGLGVLLVPLGALALIVGASAAARSTRDQESKL